jgi:hypothetical protein
MPRSLRLAAVVLLLIAVAVGSSGPRILATERVFHLLDQRLQVHSVAEAVGLAIRKRLI